MRLSAGTCGIALAGTLLPPVNNGLNFHQARERTAEAACVAVAEEFGDIRQGLARIDEQPARNFQAQLCKHFAVTRAQAPEMTLQRTPADFERTGRAIEGCVTVPQRCDNGRADRLK